MKSSSKILPIIVISQFFCTSLWFAGNGVMHDLVINYSLKESSIGHLTSAVQLGFILGTLIFAMFTITDRISPSKVFFFCAMFGALFNVGIVLDGNSLVSIIALRFFTGFFLAGIYPVGMKIASDYYEKGLGKSLGFIVGALVIGTALPHLLKDISGNLNWKIVILFTSVLAVIGGVLMWLRVPDGPYRKPGAQVNFSACFSVFKNRAFSSAAVGYFGHMWELYAFWTFVPLILKAFVEIHPEVHLNISLLSFVIIGVGGIACVFSGYLAAKIGEKKVATLTITLSMICCFVLPFLFYTNSAVLFIIFLLFWGVVVVADSPMFSTLIAQNAASTVTGTAFTIVNCIGFTITIVSIQLMNTITTMVSSNFVFVLLGLGPLLGLLIMQRRAK